MSNLEKNWLPAEPIDRPTVTRIKIPGSTAEIQVTVYSDETVKVERIGKGPRRVTITDMNQEFTEVTINYEV
jgi:hypothetical protein